MNDRNVKEILIYFSLNPLIFPNYPISIPIYPTITNCQIFNNDDDNQNNQNNQNSNSNNLDNKNILLSTTNYETCSNIPGCLFCMGFSLSLSLSSFFILDMISYISLNKFFIF